MSTWNWFLGPLAIMLIVVVAMGALDSMHDHIWARRFGAWAYRVADKAYDLLLVPVARIHSASGHPSLLHVAKHVRG